MGRSLVGKVQLVAFGLVGAAALFADGVLGDSVATADVVPAVVEVAPVGGGKSIVIDVKSFVAKDGEDAQLTAVDKQTGEVVFSKVVKVGESNSFQLAMPLPVGTYDVSLGIAGDSDSHGVPVELGIVAAGDEMLFDGEWQMEKIEWRYRGIV